MPKLIALMSTAAVGLWKRFNEFLNSRAEREVMAWGSALQYKRRYTNPDAAKAYRRVP